MGSEKPVVLVTGAGGQLGLTLEKLGALQDGVRFIYVASSDLDITDIKALEDAFTRYRPDYCINCAAYTNVKGAEKERDRAFEINAQAAGSLAGVCEAYKCVLIHISTDYVFDGQKNTPYTPDDTPNPLNVYGASKLAGEKAIAEHCSRYYIVRTSWLYSKEFGKNFYRTILANALEKKPMNIITSQRGTPTNTEHLAAYLISLIQGEEPFGVKHFSDEVVMSWYDFAVQILEENDLDTSLLTPVAALGRDEVDRPAYSALTAS